MLVDIDPGYIAVTLTMICTYLGYLQGKYSVPPAEAIIESTIDRLIEDGYVRVDSEGEILKWDEEKDENN